MKSGGAAPGMEATASTTMEAAAAAAATAAVEATTASKAASECLAGHEARTATCHTANP
jgi:hypothetical protein